MNALRILVSSLRYFVIWSLLITAAAFASPGDATAADAAADEHRAYARFDNDILAERDQGYSNGTEIGLVSPTFARFDDARLSGAERWLNRGLAWLQPRGFAENTMTISISHQMYTPRDGYRSDLIEDDRPYAGMLLASVGYNGRDDDSMRSTLLQVGILGPSARAEEVQDFVHGLTGTHRFSGWDNQLADEPVVRVLEQRYRRYALPSVFQSSMMADAIVHGGVSLGNLATYANAGAELRFGAALPDNFGSAPWLPTGEVATPARESLYTQTLKIHAFVAVDVRYVVRDITLDGNTWQDSHSVEHRDWVADVGIGIAARFRGWKVAIARYHRTREFVGQAQAAELGSITIRKEI